MAPSPHFDPNNPAHKTILEWAAAGDYDWFHHAFSHAALAGEARVLLRCGSVLKMWWDADLQRIQVEELP